MHTTSVGLWAGKLVPGIMPGIAGGRYNAAVRWLFLFDSNNAIAAESKGLDGKWIGP